MNEPAKAVAIRYEEKRTAEALCTVLQCRIHNLNEYDLDRYLEMRLALKKLNEMVSKAAIRYRSSQPRMQRLRIFGERR